MVINATCLNSRICGRTVHQTVSCGCFRHLDLHFLLSTLRHCLNFYNEKISLLYYENTRKMFQLGTKLKKKKGGGTSYEWLPQGTITRWFLTNIIYTQLLPWHTLQMNGRHWQVLHALTVPQNDQFLEVLLEKLGGQHLDETMPAQLARGHVHHEMGLLGKSTHSAL